MGWMSQLFTEWREAEEIQLESNEALTSEELNEEFYKSVEIPIDEDEDGF